MSTIVESLQCTLETNITQYANYTLIKKKSKTKIKKPLNNTESWSEERNHTTPFLSAGR